MNLSVMTEEKFVREYWRPEEMLLREGSDMPVVEVIVSVMANNGNGWRSNVKGAAGTRMGVLSKKWLVG